jgi:multidrug efflux pump subunit AcrB
MWNVKLALRRPYPFIVGALLVEHIESQSVAGVTVIKVFFQRGARFESAAAQMAAVSQTILRIMPPGATAPFLVRYHAANVPVLQLALGGDSLCE